MSKSTERTRRTPEQRIAALQAKIQTIKQRAERAKVQRSPALRHMNTALKSLEKAMAETDDAATKRALEEARATLSATLALNGVVVARSSDGGASHGRRSTADVAGLQDRLLEHVRVHPGQRGEEIAAALGTDTTTMRPAMKKLIAAGAVRTTGKNRGMRYFVG
ncbi:MAG: hypothetical protein K8S98_15720 [Planctomycetes bacterium]|nr:hypothetical protein [Planctomycetota bacterium]